MLNSAVRNSIIPLVVLIALAVLGCNDPSEYDRLSEEERAERDTTIKLFLGYELGMPRQAFYEHSLDLNKKGMVMQGPQNQTVQYELNDELPYPAKMYYYPDFHEERIFRMRVRFRYDGWSPWNRHLYSDSLQVDVVDLFREWYGEGFVKREVDQNEGGDDYVYLKIDENRRIAIAKQNDKDVIAVITDMSTEENM